MWLFRYTRKLEANFIHQPCTQHGHVGYIDCSGKVQLVYLIEWKEVSYRH